MEASGRYARHADLVRWTTSFSDLAAFASFDMAVGVGQEARERRIGIVSASFFGFFDAPPAAGRYFTRSEIHCRPACPGSWGCGRSSLPSRMCQASPRLLPAPI
ncbi:MAG TPA: hypothetical protein VEV39_11295 [Gemmatimonadales bacterium]|nr:hypothetical protein [Gemmatimonadales bacterium]